MSGKLYICPTPIGNLDDITYRTLKVLNSVDLIAAEDTRHSIKLLNHFEISKPLTSYHEHNKNSKGPVLIDKLKSGLDIALVSDAGMPGISDPGADMVGLCIDEGIEVEVLPGASAFVIALVGSGMDTNKFVFEGFLDRDKKKKKNRLEEIKNEYRTMIVYESPHRLKETLKLMLDILGDRKISLCRELTKKHEDYMRNSIDEAISYYKENDPRGEYILIIEGNTNPCKEEGLNEYEDLSDRDYVIKLIENNITKKDAIKTVAKERGLRKDDVYKQVLDL
ncbi:MAG: 16S rRNA (cytidine(1402)-2'-O)-methyltransferase [Peptostreptococcus sp.]|uniref:16S rRNA (cytidine(1402)-2'-O)-methyltransferase n=1 Tax=Peptostreptococcus TaxID=1257 RepID=UPI00290FD566|nr:MULTISPECIES: 16S rRNA (cytidine(1402)-2'-O)-methyltransferase [Peptostreptococcus]MDU3422306.1 16S rRNA (cytidine(1402)-2'-O)-methyltransferase [Peptostreptococcus anaerobius]MDU3429191.1 16S rRNA (cytidine(1402)-2'-O)-methyltransferase [Peptostreptococcus sp.]MDU3454315.1 16S rRNA (cytidine(1402)-2'-O)-methyltransferase [Peptostreptococcus sp.]MDU5349758.1 16S rRNA (cytidine(1402)-2'-O)-methyltransferase [Peptostreptococcus sp.]MDU5567521.1 16S rRNA (cytidine(1402)-2'-O)-methyltransferase